jgi:hypothetical protein
VLASDGNLSAILHSVLNNALRKLFRYGLVTPIKDVAAKKCLSYVDSVLTARDMHLEWLER